MNTPFISAPARLLATAARLGEAPAYLTREAEGWQATSWRGYAEQVQQAARALVSLGVRPGEPVCILGFNRPEWVIMDVAAMMAGAVAAGIYWTSAADEVAYVVEHSGCTVLLVENAAQWAKIADRPALLVRMSCVVMMDGRSDKNANTQHLSWADFLALGTSDHGAEVARRLAALGTADMGTLIYTSGTTGPPKAVMLSHGNLSWTADALCRAFAVGPADRLISYLPLAHIAEQMGAIHNHLQAGYSLYFARSMERLGEHLKEVRPTVFFGVPRVWEKMQTAIEAKLAAATGLKARLAAWALAVGRQWHADALAGRPHGPLQAGLKALAGRLIHKKVQAALGFDAARILLSGAAPIAPDTLRFFTGLDLLIGEVYGQSEGSGPTAISLPGSTRIGAVGKPLPGLEVRIADDDEILVRGPNVFVGYLKRPDDSAEALQNAWLHSGDLGRFDADGYLYVTGRKKDLLITSGGKNISPANLEAELMGLPLVEHAVVCGEGRHFLTALLALKPEALADFARRTVLVGAPSSWLRDPVLLAELQRGIDAINASQARVAQIKKFSLLAEPLTVESGLLTATMKIKRRLLIERHQDVVARMYL